MDWGGSEGWGSFPRPQRGGPRLLAAVPRADTRGQPMSSFGPAGRRPRAGGRWPGWSGRRPRGCGARPQPPPRPAPAFGGGRGRAPLLLSPHFCAAPASRRTGQGSAAVTSEPSPDNLRSSFQSRWEQPGRRDERVNEGKGDLGKAPLLPDLDGHVDGRGRACCSPGQPCRGCREPVRARAGLWVPKSRPQPGLCQAREASGARGPVPR